MNKCIYNCWLKLLLKIAFVCLSVCLSVCPFGCTIWLWLSLWLSLAEDVAGWLGLWPSLAEDVTGCGWLAGWAFSPASLNWLWVWQFGFQPGWSGWSLSGPLIITKMILDDQILQVSSQEPQTSSKSARDHFQNWIRSICSFRQSWSSQLNLAPHLGQLFPHLTLEVIQGDPEVNICHFVKFLQLNPGFGEIWYFC